MHMRRRSAWSRSGQGTGHCIVSRALTKAQLAAQLEAAHVAYQQLEQRYTAAVAAGSVVRPRTVVRPVAQAPRTTYAATCAKARELAMRTGKCVLVG